MEFEKRKAATLSSLSSSEPDKSPKGGLDEPIIPLLTTINNHRSYFTTSSCSGRISILAQPKTINPTHKKKARGGSWLYITHDPADPDSVISLLFPNNSEVTENSHQISELVFRFEPLIIAVESRDLVSAQFLVSLAIASGFRESGITSCGDGKRVIIAIRCSIRMEVPLGDTEKLMVSSEYLRFLVEVANEKMEANRKRTDGFLVALKSNGFGEVNGIEDLGVDENGDNIERDSCSLESGPVGTPSCGLSLSTLPLVGESVEKLFVWGHSACSLETADRKEVLVFGGFGGIGRHARRNESFLLNLLKGTLEKIHSKDSPTPRLGHTSSLVGKSMFVIGGRADPLNILNEVWVLNTMNYQWKLRECTGSIFPPRHRHAAAVVGSNIYVFGGLNNDVISSSLYVLDTCNLHWEEITVRNEWPCARHSHAMVAYGTKLFMFGGYNGEKALGDLYSFDVESCLWKTEKVVGQSPHARFSHSMFVYKHFLGLLGGCPLVQLCQELALYDLQLRVWRHINLTSLGEELFVRSTVNVVGDDLVTIGGGAACYAFGTTFTKPMKINLLEVMTLNDKNMHPEVEGALVTQVGKMNSNFQELEVEDSSTKNRSLDIEIEQCQNSGASHFILQLEKKYAKLAKDILKKFGWLDLKRKVYSRDDSSHICFPVNAKLSAIFHETDFSSDVSENRPFIGVYSLDEISCSKAFSILRECGATKQVDEVVEVRNVAKSPLEKMKELVASLIEQKGLSTKLLEQLPARWERLGDIVVLPVTSFTDPVWRSIGKELWPAIAKLLHGSRLARQGRVASTGTRDSTLEILVGDNGWVEHREKGILYSFDATKCMFSWGNLSEKLRMGLLDCKNEIVVDLFAGIGYFVLPFLIRAKAKLVYACEWNPHAVQALKRNIDANSVSDRCIILEGDNRLTAPKGIADRVCLGLIPTSEGSWATAVRALRSEGGVLHVHGNVKDTEETLWTEHALKSINEIATSQGHCWEVTLEHLERVKWYAPHIRHVVADVRCKQIRS